MIKFARIAALTFGLLAIGPTPNSEAASPTNEARNAHVFRGSAQWTRNPPPNACGPFSALLVHSTQADPTVVEVIYQFGDTCNNTFGSVSGTGQVTVNGNLQRLRFKGTIPANDERSFSVDITLKRTCEDTDRDGSDRTVSAEAKGTVILGGVDLTGGATTTNASISRSKT
jgi:hypothetical protein